MEKHRSTPSQKKELLAGYQTIKRSIGYHLFLVRRKIIQGGAPSSLAKLIYKSNFTMVKLVIYH